MTLRFSPLASATMIHTGIKMPAVSTDRIRWRTWLTGWLGLISPVYGQM
jgi:hypothetical protein